MQQNTSHIKICVRLPNWLGDTVMSLGFLYLLRQAYPNAFIAVITKKGLEDLVGTLPEADEVFVFSKQEYKGIRGVWKFGKRVLKPQNFDLFFVLPDSFSSAVMAYASSAKKRIGFRAEGRSFLLTHTYYKPVGKHRVEDYASLIQQYDSSVASMSPVVRLPHLQTQTDIESYMIVNTNSESITSRLPVEKAVELITLIQQQISLPIIIIGAPKEAVYVEEVLQHLPNKNEIENKVGKTTLPELQSLIQNASLMITSDSGPAHIASASGIPLIVITGAGDERNTGPYQNPKAMAVRNGSLPCEPCVKNYCKLSPLPQCLVQMNMQKAIDAADFLVKKDNDKRI